MNLPDLISAAIAGAEDVATTFMRPDDDWVSVALIDGIPFALDTWGSKDAALRALCEAVRVVNPESVVLIASAWAAVISPLADGTPPDPMDHPRASEHPDRFELLTILGCSSDGEVRTVDARIIRDVFDPPRLAEWKATSNGATSGAFVDAIREGWARCIPS